MPNEVQNKLVSRHARPSEYQANSSPVGMFSPAQPDAISSAAQDNKWHVHSLLQLPLLADSLTCKHPLRFINEVCQEGCRNLLPILPLRCGEEAPRLPIYRPDLDADVTQQSGTVCAAALLCFMEQQLPTA